MSIVLLQETDDAVLLGSSISLGPTCADFPAGGTLPDGASWVASLPVPRSEAVETRVFPYQYSGWQYWTVHFVEGEFSLGAPANQYFDGPPGHIRWWGPADPREALKLLPWVSTECSLPSPLPEFHPDSVFAKEPWLLSRGQRVYKVLHYDVAGGPDLLGPWPAEALVAVGPDFVTWVGPVDVVDAYLEFYAFHPCPEPTHSGMDSRRVMRQTWQRWKQGCDLDNILALEAASSADYFQFRYPADAVQQLQVYITSEHASAADGGIAHAMFEPLHSLTPLELRLDATCANMSAAMADVI
jgi:hypothetical protein